MSLFTKLAGLDPVQSGYRKNQATALEGVGSLAPTYQNQVSGGSNLVGQFSPQRTTTGQALLDRQKMGFDNGGFLKRKILGSIGTGFDSAAANARVNAARTGANPAASLSILDARKAAATTNALTDYEGQKRAMDMQYAKDAFGTASNLTGQGLDEQSAGLAGLQRIFGTQFAGYGDLAQQEEAAKAAAQQRLMSMITGGANLIGGLQGAPQAPVMSGGRGVGGGSFSMPDLPSVSNAGAGSGMDNLILRRLRQGQLYSGGY